MVLETDVHIKEEPPEQGSCVSEALALYAEHDIKQELDIGPAVLQQSGPPGVAPAQTAARVRAGGNVQIKEEGNDEMSVLDLYEDHEIKEELVIGPVVLQRPGPPAAVEHTDNTDAVEQLSSQYCCELCNQSFHDDSALSRHKQTHRESNTLTLTEKRFTCYDCKKIFSEKRFLVQHIVCHNHSGGTLFSCDVCNKRFISKYYLKHHLRLHPEFKPFSCRVCKKHFTRKYTLNRHELIHTGDKLFSCDICSKRFINKSDLVIHQRIHTGYKPFSCDVCRKQFTQTSNLLRHKRLHTGDKPFSCDVCKKQFTQTSHLIRHKRLHTGDKPFSCNICNKRFIYKSDSVTHQRIHTGDKPFS